MEIKHSNQIVSFSHIDKNSDLFTYYFEIEQGKISLHSIDKYVKKGIKGKTYTHVEIYHKRYKPNVYNYETNEFEQPKIPQSVQKNADNLCTGFLINSFYND